MACRCTIAFTSENWYKWCSRRQRLLACSLRMWFRCCHPERIRGQQNSSQLRPHISLHQYHNCITYIYILYIYVICIYKVCEFVHLCHLHAQRIITYIYIVIHLFKLLFVCFTRLSQEHREEPGWQCSSPAKYFRIFLLAAPLSLSRPSTVRCISMTN